MNSICTREGIQDVKTEPNNSYASVGYYILCSAMYEFKASTKLLKPYGLSLHKSSVFLGKNIISNLEIAG